MNVYISSFFGFFVDPNTGPLTIMLLIFGIPV
jgi:hypothetical protein